MEIIAEPYGALPCHLQTFKINDIVADEGDFGHNADVDMLNAPDYGCGCRKFIADDEPQKGILEKYKITYTEWLQVCEKLEAVLYVGRCGWCI